MESWGLSSWVCHSVTLGRFHVTIIIRSANTHTAQIQINIVFVSNFQNNNKGVKLLSEQ